jgi:hypothetical protein
VSRSSVEAEYRLWLLSLLNPARFDNSYGNYNNPINSATIVYCDNVSAVYLSANPVHHRRTKPIELDIHFVREKVPLGAVRVLHVPSSSQFADIFTKGLPTLLFQEF